MVTKSHIICGYTPYSLGIPNRNIQGIIVTMYKYKFNKHEIIIYFRLCKKKQVHVCDNTSMVLTIWAPNPSPTKIWALIPREGERN